MTNAYGDRERIERRLSETGLMDTQFEATMPLAHLGQLLAAAEETAVRALNALSAKQVDPLTLMEVEQGLNAIVNRFTNPIRAVTPERDGDPFQTVTFRIGLAPATAFSSLVVAAIVTMKMPKPSRPEPPYTDVEAMVSGEELLWWALLNLVGHFPPPVMAILNEETGLNFDAIR